MKIDKKLLSIYGVLLFSLICFIITKSHTLFYCFSSNIIGNPQRAIVSGFMHANFDHLFINMIFLIALVNVHNYLEKYKLNIFMILLFVIIASAISNYIEAKYRLEIGQLLTSVVGASGGILGFMFMTLIFGVTENNIKVIKYVLIIMAISFVDTAISQQKIAFHCHYMGQFLGILTGSSYVYLKKTRLSI